MQPIVRPWLTRLTKRRRAASAEDRALDTAPIDDYHAWVSSACRRLGVAEPFTVEELLKAVEAYLACELAFEQRDWEGAELYGALCPNGITRYLVVLRHDLTRRNRIKTLYHEIAHLLRGHALATETQYRAFEPTTPQDIEAEEIARILFTMTLVGGPRQPFLERFIESMGGAE